MRFISQLTVSAGLSFPLEPAHIPSHALQVILSTKSRAGPPPASNLSDFCAISFFPPARDSSLLLRAPAIELENPG